MLLYRLFRTHFQIVSEAKLQQMILNGNIKVSDRVSTPAEIEECTEICCHCKGDVNVPTKREIQPVVGSRGCVVTCTGICPACSKALTRITKFNHGLVFHKLQDGGQWEAVITYPPLWLQWLQKLKPPTIVIES
jgi:hypothetical protein